MVGVGRSWMGVGSNLLSVHARDITHWSCEFTRMTQIVEAQTRSPGRPSKAAREELIPFNCPH